VHKSSSFGGYYLAPLNCRLPNTFRLQASEGTFTFRADNLLSFHVWTAAITERIHRQDIHGQMDLSSVIAEEESVARARRLDDLAVLPIVNCTLQDTDTKRPVEIIRFGIEVAAYKELSRQVAGTIGMSWRNTEQQLGMLLSVLEDAKNISSKSVMLLHSLAATKQQPEDDGKSKHYVTDKLVKEQKQIQAKLGQLWDASNTGEVSLPPIDLFDGLLLLLQPISK